MDLVDETLLPHRVEAKSGEDVPLALWVTTAIAISLPLIAIIAACMIVPAGITYRMQHLPPYWLHFMPITSISTAALGMILGSVSLLRSANLPSSSERRIIAGLGVLSIGISGITTVVAACIYMFVVTFRIWW
jgi:hypothetical protein